METESLLTSGNIKQDPDCESSRSIEVNTSILDDRIKEEQDNDSFVVKKEANGDEASYMCFVIKKTRTNTTSLPFPHEDSFLYCEKCKLKYEQDCPEHGPLIYVDNAEINHGCTQGFSLQVQVVENMDRHLPRTEMQKESELCGEHEEYHLCTDDHIPLSEVEHLQMINCDKYLELGEQDSLLDVLNEYNTNNLNKSVNFEMTRATNMTEDTNKESKMCEENDQQKTTAIDSDSICDSMMTFQNENHSTESHKMFSICKVNPEFGAADRNYQLRNRAGNKNYKQKDIVRKTYICDVCGIAFKCYSQMSLHKRIHAGEKPYMCDNCGASFSMFSKVKRHIKLHMGERPYQCDICGLAFAQLNHLKEHRLIHTGVKPFKCDVCSACFVTFRSLKRHKLVHTGDKPYQCDVCGASFAAHYSLKIHQKCHSEDKPYTCPICSFGFIRRSDFNRHKKYIPEINHFYVIFVVQDLLDIMI